MREKEAPINAPTEAEIPTTPIMGAAEKTATFAAVESAGVTGKAATPAINPQIPPIFVQLVLLLFIFIIHGGGYAGRKYLIRNTTA